MAGYASAQESNPPVTISERDATIKSILSELEAQTGFVFFYNNQLVDVQKKVSITAKEKPLADVLNELFNRNNIQYKVMGKQIALFPKGGNADEAIEAGTQSAGIKTTATASQSNTAAQSQASQPKRVIKGNVVSAEDGSPLEFITVVVKGTADYTITDQNGNYALSTSKTDGVVEFGLLGYTTVEEPINGRSIVNAKLSSEANMLSNVVVTGYQVLSKERVTGSFSVISSEDINKSIATSITSGLEGRLAGVVKSGNDFVIRGVSTFNAVSSPLYVIDGYPVEGDSPSYKASGVGSYLEYSPPSIRPEEVESITILKDAAAASIYGARAANGVVVVTTKKAAKGKAQINFSARTSITPKRDYSRSGYMSASDFIDMEYEFMENYKAIHNPSTSASTISDFRYNLAISPTLDLMLKMHEGKISQAEADRLIDTYRSSGTPFIDDWSKHILQNQVTQNYYLSVSKASEGMNTFGSISYNDYSGSYKNTENNSLEVNLRNSFDVYKWLSVDLNANIRSSKNQSAQIATVNKGTSVGSYFGYNGMGPYTRLVDEDGNPQVLPTMANGRVMDILDQYSDKLKNLDVILQDELNRNIEKTERFRSRLSATVNVKFTNWLKFSTGISYDSDRANISTLFNKESLAMRLQYDNFSYRVTSTGEIVNRLPYGDSYQEEAEKTQGFTQRNQLNFSYVTDNRLHSVTAMAGSELREISGNRQSTRVWGYNEDLLSYTVLNNKDLSSSNSSILGTGSQSLSYGDFFSKMENLNRFVSWYGNVSYTFDERFDLTGSIRWDLSNLFGTNPKHQYKPLWSAGAAWNVGKEDFISSIEWIDRLRLRATYGINGNIAKTVSPYLIASYGFSQETGQYSATVSRPPNANLRWEKTRIFNVGIDFAVLKNRLSGSLDFYHKRSSDLLSDATIDPSYGFSTLMLNVGEVLNKGVELSLGTTPVRKRDFSWNLNFSFAYNKNEVTTLLYEPKQASELYTSSSKLREGYPQHSMYSYRFVRINEKGETVILNEKNEEVSLVNVTSIDALEYSGTTEAPYTGGLQNTLRYKGLELSLNIIYNMGHVTRKRTLDPHMLMPNGLMYDSYGNRWREPGDELKPGVTPRLTFRYDSGTNYRNAHWLYNNSQVVSASYIKLRSVTLGYTLPKALIQKTVLKDVTLRMQVNNPLYWAANGDFDPEAGVYIVSNKPSYSFGINISL